MNSKMPTLRRTIALVSLGVFVVLLIVAARRGGRPKAAPVVTSRALPSAQAPLGASRATSLASISGTVTDPESVLIAEARVCAVVSSTFAATTRGICSDSDLLGRYVIRGLPKGSYFVTAARAEFVTGSAHGGRPLDLLDVPSLTGVEIVLQHGGAKVTGAVVDATGGPVPHATVRGERAVPPRVAVDVEADDLGRFALWFPPGPMILSAQAVGYAPARWNGPAPSVNVRLTLTPGATVRGFVIASSTGERLPNIEVRAVPSSMPLSPLFRSSVTDESGSFDVRGLEPGSYTMIATGNGWHGEHPRPVRLELGSTVANVRVEVDAAAEVTGRVLLADSLKPCDQGLVGLHPLDANEPPPKADAMAHRPRAGPSFRADIGADGVAHFPAVAKGRYSVTVECAGNVLRDGPRAIDVGEESVSGLTWKVGPGLRLTVLAVDDDNRPIPGAEVLLQMPAGGVVPVRADDVGRYELSALEPGTYEASSRPPVQAERVRIDLHEGDRPATLRLKMAGSASLLVTVRERGGAPIDGLVVTAVARSTADTDAGAAPRSNDYPGAHTMIAMALGEGRYRIAPVQAGHYEVRADDAVNPTLRVSRNVAFREEAQVTIEMNRGGSISGRVLDDDGAPVPNVWVIASALAPDPDRPFFLKQMVAGLRGGGPRALTDEDGGFVIDQIAAGQATYTLHVDEPGGSAAVKDGVNVGDRDIVITLHASGTLAGTVSGDCEAGTVRLEAVSLETGQTAGQDIAAPGEAFTVTLAPGHVRVTACCRASHAVAQLTRELAAKETVGGLQLVLGPPLAQLQPNSLSLK